MADIAKLDAALAHIEEHPREWNQRTYGLRTPCGTAGCVAFHVGLLDDADITWRSPDGGDCESIWEIDGATPHQYARDALDLSRGQAESLFFEGNTLTDLKAMRSALAANPDIGGDELFDVREDCGGAPATRDGD